MRDAAVTVVLLLTVLAPLALTQRFRRGARREHRAPGAGRSPNFGDRRTRAVLGVVLVAVALLGPEVLSLVR